jgi:hypothetical protein
VGASRLVVSGIELELRERNARAEVLATRFEA